MTTEKKCFRNYEIFEYQIGKHFFRNHFEHPVGEKFYLKKPSSSFSCKISGYEVKLFLIGYSKKSR